MIIFLVAAQVGPVIGDVVYTRDGGRHEGVVRQEEDTVFIETADGTVEVSADDVLYISVVAPPDPNLDAQTTPDDTGTYLLVPIQGTIGVDFTAQDMADHIVLARELNPDVVILYVNTGGGSTAHAEAIINLIIENDDLRFVAYVRRALSAGAAITMTCSEIYVEEVATIGAVLSWSFVDGMPTPTAEKFQSIWRAACRKAAQHGGHNSLLAEAMVDAELELTVRTEDGQILVERNGEGKVLTAQGRLLTLTATEAVECGLAAGMVDDAADFMRKLGFDDLVSVETGTGIYEAAAPDAEPEEGTPEALFQELQEKIVELGFGSEEMTTLQEEKALDGLRSYLTDSVEGRRFAWSVAVHDIDEQEPDSLRKMLVQAEQDIKTARAAMRAAARKSQERRYWRQRVDELEVWKIAVQRAMIGIRDFPFWVLASAGKGEDSGWIVAYVTEDERSLIEDTKPGDSLLLRGKIQQVSLESGDGDPYWLIRLGECMAGGSDMADDEDTDEAEVQYLLKLAKMYRASGNLATEREKLMDIVTLHSETESAAAARERIEEIDAEMLQATDDDEAGDDQDGEDKVGDDVADDNEEDVW